MKLKNILSNTKNAFFLPLILITLSSCGGVDQYRDNLVKVTAPSYFVLEKHLEYTFDIENVFGQEVVRIVKFKRGRYTAFSENENGTYYTTEDGDYNFLNIIKVEGEVFGHPDTGFHMGGLWITKEQNPKAFPYLINGGTKSIEEGLNYFNNSNLEVPRIEENGYVYKDHIPSMGTDELILHNAASSTVVGYLATMDIGKPTLELEMPPEVFRKNIKIIHH